MIAMVSTERKHWVDVAKGILIILVVWGHLDYFASTYAGTSIFSYKAYTNFAFLPYYMPAFFIVTGFCSSFESDFVPFLKKNIELFENERVRENTKLKQKLDKLTEKDFTRQPSLVERRASQSQSLNLPVLPTTTIGSFPQTAEVRKVRLQNKRGELSQADYDTFLEEKIKECLKLQEDIGLDVLVHGEFERNDMVEYFGEKLEGYVFTQKAWVQSYGTRCVKPPIVWTDVTRPEAMTVRWSAYAQSQTSKPVKGMRQVL